MGKDAYYGQIIECIARQKYESRVLDDVLREQQDVQEVCNTYVGGENRNG